MVLLPRVTERGCHEALAGWVPAADAPWQVPSDDKALVGAIALRSQRGRFAGLVWAPTAGAARTEDAPHIHNAVAARWSGWGDARMENMVP